MCSRAARALFIACTIFASPGTAYAFDAFETRVPNLILAVNSFGETRGCITCHNNPDGGFGCAPNDNPLGRCWNPFGKDFFDNGQVWNATLGNMDSDGDGFTNAQELQDFDSSWTVGTPYPGVRAYATLPGFANQTPGDVDADADRHCYVGFDANQNGHCRDAGENTGTHFDCNDNNASVNSSATEICTNKLDNDCNGLTTVHDPVCSDVVDADGDGWCPSGRDLNGNGNCLDPGEMDHPGDCDDTRLTVYPGAPENCSDGVDNNCNGLVDGDDPACTGEADADGDGFCPIGQDLNGNGNCLDPGEPDLPSDCNDNDPLVHPDAEEICNDLIDNDCNGLADFEDPYCAQYLDQDGDGYCPVGRDLNRNGHCLDEGEAEAGFDCNDNDPTINSGATEICTDDVDQNCDGLAGILDPTCVGYLDLDGDGFCPVGADKNGDGDCIDGPHEAPLVNARDCDDTNPLVHPLAIENCFDGIDNDCNGAIDAKDPVCQAYVDFDLDGYCQPGLDLDGNGDCTGPDEQTDDFDLLPYNPTAYPGAPENCLDNIDNDQDGFVDLEDEKCHYDEDRDGDGFCPLGRDLNGDGDCLDPGEQIQVTDCNDDDPEIHPFAEELCLVNLDMDCDGRVYLDDLDCIELLADRDGDGFCGRGVDDDGDGLCISEGEDRFGHDCNDFDAQISPAAVEICDDGIDNDCDGLVDLNDPNCFCGSDDECPGKDICTIGACHEGICRYTQSELCQRSGTNCAVSGVGASPGAGGGWPLALLFIASIGCVFSARRLRRRGVLSGFFGLLVVLGAPAESAHAWDFYRTNVPNGNAIYTAMGGASSATFTCNGSSFTTPIGPGCRMCHQSNYGGYASSCGNLSCPGSQSFADNGKCHNRFGARLWAGPDGFVGTADDSSWGANVARSDSDGDGWSNGQEVGDPFGLWSSGLTPQFAYLSSPGWPLGTNIGTVVGRRALGYDICAANRHDCATTATCGDPSSTQGNWTCSCNQGYQGGGHRRTGLGSSWWGCNGSYGSNCYTINSLVAGCADCNECLGQCGGHLCGPGTCSNAGGSWNCTCPSGYSTTTGVNSSGTVGGRCVDINECSSDALNACCKSANLTPAGTCQAVAGCSNTAGSYNCACPPGYTGNGRTDGTGCTNINECAQGENCGGNGACVDNTGLTPGWSCNCDEGFSPIAAGPGGIGQTCVVADECSTGADNCHYAAICYDPNPSPGSLDDYICTCPPGWTQPGDGRGANGCLDIDECLDPFEEHNCGRGVDECQNLEGSYMCTCMPGFESVPDVGTPPGDGVGETCANVDECSDPSPPECGGLGTCVDSTPDPSDYVARPAWRCDCAPGYIPTPSGIGQTCVNANECAGEGTGHNCDPNALCTDTIGGFDCTCNAGFLGDGVLVAAGGTGCTDINECADGSHNCHLEAICENVPGSFNCTCKEGFEGDGVSCTDVDECAVGTAECDMYATCKNLYGSYDCMCNDGFIGTGFVDGCVDLNECASGTACGANEVCVNRLADANLCVCAPGYTRLDPSRPCARTCGDGVRGPGEECDDGNLNDGDGCSAQCVVEAGWACYDDEILRSICEETCGDGILRIPGEECDDGEANSDTAPNACRTNCRLAHCGDGVIDEGEECDDGRDNSDLATGACRTSCREPYCGDGVVDMGELCDFGRGEPLDPSACIDECDRLPGEDAGVGARAKAGCSVGAGTADLSWYLLAFILTLLIAWRSRRASSLPERRPPQR